MALKKWLSERKWTPELISQWQEFYVNGPRVLFAGVSGDFYLENMTRLPTYEDLRSVSCSKQTSTATLLPNTSVNPKASAAVDGKSFLPFVFIWSILLSVI